MLSAAFLLATLAALTAGVLGGFTGFGLSAIAVPLLLLVYEPARSWCSMGRSRPP